MSSVQFSNADNHYKPTGKRKLKTFVVDMCLNEGKRVRSLDYVFCSDEYLLGLNNDFLNHDYYTDVITFDLGSPEDNEITGEIYISIDRVKENAKSLENGFKEELLRVILHGALHMCGYKDKTKSESKLMRSKEEHYLLLFEKKIDASL